MRTRTHTGKPAAKVQHSAVLESFQDVKFASHRSFWTKIEQICRKKSPSLYYFVPTLSKT